MTGGGGGGGEMISIITVLGSVGSVAVAVTV